MILFMNKIIEEHKKTLTELLHPFKYLTEHLMGVLSRTMLRQWMQFQR